MMQDKDPVLYRFFLNDDPVTKWTKENQWVWTTTEDDLGESQIEVQVRDGNHAGPDKYDADMGTGFAINAPQPVPLESANQSNLAEEWIRKGDALYNRSNYDEAIRLAPSDPNIATAWKNKGQAHFNQGKYDETLLCMDKVIEMEEHAQ